ncbi:MAG: tetratricopeptide repeat protein [Cyclobacteriaceae bacterium]|nr:tetratricopeptide repeat protein [Cyclobacteriaceae bacterium]
MKLKHYLIAFSFLITFITNGQSNLQRGISLYQSKKYSEAIQLLNSVNEKSEDYAEARYYLGRIAYDKKLYNDAVDYFKEASKANPKSGDYFNWLGDSYSAIGSTASMFTQMSVGPKALKAWEKATELDPKNIRARVSLVDSYMMAPAFMGGGEDNAKKMAGEVFPLLEESFQNSSTNFLHHYWYGKIAAITGLKLDKGELSLEKYLTYTPQKGEPSLAGANMRLGQIKEKQGNKAEAKKYYEAALKLDSKLESAQKGLERVSK